MAAQQTSADHLRGKLLFDEPMSRHTVWGIGGPAKQFFSPVDVEDLTTFLRTRDPSLELFWLGLGSNLLVRDGGLDCAVINVSSLPDWLEWTETTVRVSAGMACPKLARRCVRQGVGGLEFFAGIPGTVGGALAMNAGAFGGETWSRVVRVTCMDTHGRLQVRERDEFQAAYRQLVKPAGPADEWFVDAEFAVDPDVSGDGEAKVKSLLALRAATQPMGQRSCGSVFRNPTDDHAARLIEACGLKGHRIGNAEVSLKHANFIVNSGAARAADVEALINLVRDKVRADTGVELRPEVQIVGSVDVQQTPAQEGIE